MTALEIKNKVLEVAKSKKGGNSFIVIKDTENGGIYGTDASISDIRSGGGVACIIEREQVVKDYAIYEQTWWAWAGNETYMTSLNEICKETEKLWN